MLGWGVRMAGVGLVAGAVGAGFGYQWFDREILSTLPASLDQNAQFRIPCSVQVFATDGARVDQFYLERRVWVPIKELPEHVWRAFIASEDRRFFEHEGVDPIGIARALVVNLRGGGTHQGGSTITQQLVKNLLVGKEKSYRRKLREAVLAYRLEKELNKMQLLELYVNYIALGSGNYGVEAAAQDYFGLSAREIDAGQAAELAGLVPAPSRYSPRHRPEMAAQRRETVLRLMVEQGMIDAVEASKHLTDPVVVPRASGDHGANTAYLTETRREIRRVFGDDAPFLEGMQVHTPLDTRVQAITEQAVKDGLAALESRQGQRGPTRNVPADARPTFLERGDGLQLDPQTGTFRAPHGGECFTGLAGSSPGAGDAVADGTVTAGPWTFILTAADLDAKVRAGPGKPSRPLREVLTPGDVLDVCIPEEVGEATSGPVHRRLRPWAESAAVVIENRTGHVVALTGGFDVGLEGFVRATQAHRQPGSAFKPFVYAAAIMKGYTQTQIVTDAPFSIRGTNGLPWTPQNYDGKYHGQIPLRTAMALSLNTVAVRLGLDVGVDHIVQLANALGVRSKLRGDLTVALGSSEVSPMDLATAYASIARGGVRIEPVFVTRVLDRKGEELAREGDRVKIPGEEARLLPGGVGERVMPPAAAYVTIDMMRNVFLNGTAKKGLRPGMDFAGKTGTTSNFVDAWLVGYSPRYTVAVWVGTDGTQSLGEKETGGKSALPVWSTIMEALPNVKDERFAVPDDVVVVPVDKYWLGYARGSAPKEILVPPELAGGAPLPPFGLSLPAARAPVAMAVDVIPSARLVVPGLAGAVGADLEEGADNPAAQPPATN